MRKRKLRKKFFKSKSSFFKGILTILFLSTLILATDFYQKKNNVLISPIPKLGYKYKVDKTKELELNLKKYNISFSQVLVATDSSFVVILQNGEKVLFSSSKPTEQQMSSLQLILSRFTIEGKRFAFLDLRFDKPVVGLK